MGWKIDRRPRESCEIGVQLAKIGQKIGQKIGLRWAKIGEKNS